MDRFGDTLYNLYGSTEVGQATVASPVDLRSHPGTAGRAVAGVQIRVLDEQGRPVRHGDVGRIFVGSTNHFSGYTGGGGKAVIDGFMETGDVGRLDSGGLLFVTGRQDDMIVSGGENVFPAEVEDLLAQHPAIAEVAVVGVDDPELGQRLRAVVVKRKGARLSAKQVQDHVKAHLARHKVPRDVVFVPALPRNAAGKVMRGKIRHGEAV
jgi:fatty-acyl-CoA synthase